MSYFVGAFMGTLGVVAGLVFTLGVVSIVGGLIKYSVKRSVQRGLKNHLNKE